jgi:hypothetical protein
MKIKSPSPTELAAQLGGALTLWDKLIASIELQSSEVEQEWKASKASFGKMCLLKRKGRTLVYLTPEKKAVQVAVVLGERAVGLALASRLPEHVKKLIDEARPYAEGRGIRLPVSSVADIQVVCDLVAIKTKPKQP